MGYCTSTSVFNYLVGYKAADTATSAAIADCMVDAQNEVNKFLSDRYDVSLWNTLTATPPMVTTLCKWLAAGYTIEALGRGGKESIARAKHLIDRAMKNLEDISSGKLALADSAGSEIIKINDPNDVFSTTEDYANTFGEDDPLKWKISKQKKLDLISERRE